MSSSVRQLLELMTTSMSTLEQACAEKDLCIPDLHQPFHPTSEAFRADPTISEAANVISAAALQLAAILMPPQVSLYQVVAGHFKAAALRICLESSVTEILREAGPEGLHVNDIAAKNGQDPQKIGRFLRFLATNHIYREVEPDVFTNTRISSMLDTLKPSEEILANPSYKHDNTPGLAALASHHLDEGSKAAAHAWETLTDPKTAHSGHPEASPFARAINSQETIWEFYQRPEESFRQRRFNTGMHGVQALQSPEAILDAFNWKNLRDGAKVIDVGGGLGTAVLPLVREFPKLQVVIQDAPGVITEAGEWWSKQMPDALNSGQVRLEAHDFFTPQEEKDVAVFFLRQVLHDWSDEYCVKILTQLWNAATATTKLIIIENTIQFACLDTSADEGASIPGAIPHEAPPPLLANYGVVNEVGYIADMAMFLFCNAQERTVRQMDQLLRSAGWQVTMVHRGEGVNSNFLQSIEAIPIGK